MTTTTFRTAAQFGAIAIMILICVSILPASPKRGNKSPNHQHRSPVVLLRDQFLHDAVSKNGSSKTGTNTVPFAASLNGHGLPWRIPATAPTPKFTSGAPQDLQSKVQPRGVSSATDSINQEWVRYYTSSTIFSSYALGKAVASDRSGNYYVAGATESTWTYIDMMVIKYDAAGKVIWRQTYDGPSHDLDVATAVATDPHGNVYITGYSSGIYYDFDFLTIKYDSNGVEQWTARYDGPAHGDDTPVAIAVDGNGDVVVTGGSVGDVGLFDFLTVKYDPNGVQLWENRFDGTLHVDDGPYAMALDARGNIFVTGMTNTILREADIVTLAYAPDGSQLWIAEYDGPLGRNDLGFAITVDDSGYVYVAGASEDSTIVPGNNKYKAVIIKYSPGGIQQWATREEARPGPMDVWWCVGVSHSGCVYVGGASESAHWPDGEMVYYDPVVAAYDPNGAPLWYKIAGYFEPAALITMAVDHKNSVYAAGYVCLKPDGPSYLIVKYDSSGVMKWQTEYDVPKDYGGGVTGIALDPTEKNVAVTGYRNDTLWNPEAVTLQFSSAYGSTNWIRWYQGFGGGNEVTLSIQTDAQGNLCEFGNGYLLKYAPDGTLLWVDEGIYGNAMKMDAAGNLFVVGTRFSVNADSATLVTTKFRYDGALLWSAEYFGSDGWSLGFSLCVDSNSNVLVCGATRLSSNRGNYLTLKYSPSGQQLWNQLFQGNNDTVANAFALRMAADRVGNVYVSGNTAGSCTTVKYSSAGVQLWNASEPGLYPLAMTVSDSGDALVTGESNGPTFETVRYTQNGNFAWSALAPAGLNSHDITLDRTGNTYVLGDQSIIKYSPQGAQLWYHSDGGNSIAIDKFGGIYAAGIFTVSDTSALSIIKYDSTGIEQWRTYFEGFGTGVIYPLIALNSLDEVYLTGTARYGRWNAQGFASTIKYRQVSASRSLQYSSRNLIYPETQLGCSQSDTITIQNPTWDPVQLIVTGDSNFIPANPSLSIPIQGPGAVIISYSPLLRGDLHSIITVADSTHNISDTITVEGVASGDSSSIMVHTKPGVGWALVSAPVHSPCSIALPHLFQYDSGYRTSGSMVPGYGYWSKLPTPDVYFAGIPSFRETVAVKPRWNLIGSLSTPIAVEDVHPDSTDLILSNFYSYLPTSGYRIADSILPGAGYWMKTARAGTLTLIQAGFSGKGKSEIARSEHKPTMHQLLIRDAEGREGVLYFTDQVLSNQQIARFELPPSAPAGAFDVRFEDGYMMESFASLPANGVGIKLTSIKFPAAISWKDSFADNIFLTIDKRKCLMLHPDSIMIYSADGLRVIPQTQAASTVIRDFSLLQNYPNPFNPTTLIQYQLPNESYVRLSLYNILGQEVQTLVNKVEQPGAKSIQLDGSNLSSGIYFYRLDATSVGDPTKRFNQTRKMLLIK
ncbi:MAG: SBBP repeat-containing protein [Bacteroidota bacterium]